MDTSIVFPRPKGKKQSLKVLAEKYLNREIQKGADGHDPREDALAALDLVKLRIS